MEKEVKQKVIELIGRAEYKPEFDGIFSINTESMICEVQSYKIPAWRVDDLAQFITDAINEKIEREKGLNLEALEARLDNTLDNETEESLMEWILSRRPLDADFKQALNNLRDKMRKTEPKKLR